MGMIVIDPLATGPILGTLAEAGSWQLPPSILKFAHGVSAGRAAVWCVLFWLGPLRRHFRIWSRRHRHARTKLTGCDSASGVHPTRR